MGVSCCIGVGEFALTQHATLWHTKKVPFHVDFEIDLNLPSPMDFFLPAVTSVAEQILAEWQFN
jgi:hypothetical protein